MQNNLDKVQLKPTESQQKLEQQSDYFILKELSMIQKSIFSPNIYLWIDKNIHNQQNQQTLKLLQANDINPILCSTIEEAQLSVKKYPKDKFRIISSASIGEAMCKQLHSLQKVIHIYIFCGQKSAGQVLKKKWSKIKFYTVDVKQFLLKIQEQSRFDNRFSELPSFMKITTIDNSQDNTLINKSRYNLHGLFLFKNRSQAKNDFLKLAQYFYLGTNKSQLEDFEKEYPTEYNHAISLNWYTKETFFYKLLNNFLRSSSNPLQTSYLRLPFDATFKAIKQIYDQGKQNKKMVVYRGGFLNDKQLKYLEKNVGQYIEMFGFMSTSTAIDVAENFIKTYKGNSLITVHIEDQVRQKKIDYGYANLVKYSEFNQEQVLFNALNVFKVLYCKKQNGIHKITLKYGQLARMVKLGESKMQQKQKKILINYKHQQEIIYKWIYSQGDVFKNCQMYDSEIEYRENYLIKNKRQEQTMFLAFQLHNLGQAYKNKAEYDKAIQYFQKSLKVKKNVFGENHSSTAATLSYIGIVYDEKTEYTKALQYYQRSLNINMNLQEKDQDYRSIADTLSNIGTIYQNKDEYIKALEYFKQSLKIKRNILGENHSSTSEVLLNIGTVYYSKAEYNKALQYFQKSLKISKNVLGENHTNTATIFLNIGNVYKYTAKYNKALQYYQTSLKIFINIFGENHSCSADALNNIGNVFRKTSEYSKALQYYQRSLKIRISILGENHNKTADTLNDMGLIYQSKSQYNKAILYYQRSLKIITNILGENHTKNANTLQNIGNVYSFKNQYDKALLYYQRSLNIKLIILGENHILTADTLNNIGNAYIFKRQYKKALQYYEKSLKVTKNVLGENHDSIADKFNNIGSVYMYKAEYNQALQYFEKALKIKVKILGENHSSTSNTLYNIGLLYFQQKKYSNALVYLQRCYQVRILIFGPFHPSTIKTMMLIDSCQNH